MHLQVKIAKEIVSVTFCIPAAVGIISKLEPRLNLGPFLEDLILDYRRLTGLFWQYVKAQLGVKFHLESDFLSFVLLTFMPVILLFFRGWLIPLPSNRAEYNFWRLFSFSSMACFSYLYNCLDFFIISFVALMAVIGVFSKVIQDGEESIYTIGIVSCFIASIIFVRNPVLFGLNDIEILTGVDGIIIFMCMICYFLLIVFSVKTPAYVFLIAFGVISIDWMIHEFLPWYEIIRKEESV